MRTELEKIAELLPFEERQEFLRMNNLPNFYTWVEGEEAPTYTLTGEEVKHADSTHTEAICQR